MHILMSLAPFFNFLVFLFFFREREVEVLLQEHLSKETLEKQDNKYISDNQENIVSQSRSFF